MTKGRTWCDGLPTLHITHTPFLGFCCYRQTLSSPVLPLPVTDTTGAARVSLAFSCNRLGPHFITGYRGTGTCFGAKELFSDKKDIAGMARGERLQGGGGMAGHKTVGKVSFVFNCVNYNWKKKILIIQKYFQKNCSSCMFSLANLSR